ERILPRPERLSRLLFGCSVKELAAETPTGPAWLETILSIAARVLTAPLAIALFAVLWVTAFIRIRRELTPFLLTRPVIAGSGMIPARRHDAAGNRCDRSRRNADRAARAAADPLVACDLRRSKFDRAYSSGRWPLGVGIGNSAFLSRSVPAIYRSTTGRSTRSA